LGVDMRGPGLLGRRISIAASVATAAGCSFAFLHDLPRLREVLAASGDPITYTLISIVFPVLYALGITAAALWLAVALGLSRDRGWTPAVVAAAAVIGGIATFMPIPPTAAGGHLFPSTVALALPATVAAFVVTARWSLRLPWHAVLVGAAGSFAGLLAFINGVAATHRLMNGHGLAYLLAQGPHWALVCGWIGFVALLLSRRPRARSVGAGMACAAVVVGLPVFVTDVLHLGRFSMFGASPLWAVVVLAMLLAGRRQA